MTSLHRVTRRALTRRLRRDPHGLRMWHALDDDLGLLPLELVLVVLDIETEARVKVPVDELASVKTLGDLYRYVTKAAVDQRLAACA